MLAQSCPVSADELASLILLLGRLPAPPALPALTGVLALPAVPALAALAGCFVDCCLLHRLEPNLLLDASFQCHYRPYHSHSSAM